jgi:hypothetical protein
MDEVGAVLAPGANISAAPGRDRLASKRLAQSAGKSARPRLGREFGLSGTGGCLRILVRDCCASE